MAIELKNVSFSYPNGYLANENLSLVINDGERAAIVGQNGAGKTTAVKLMNGLNRPTEGDIIINGSSIAKKTCAQISSDVGYVFQNPDDQIFNSTVRAEVEYMPRYNKFDDAEIKRRCDKAIRLTCIEDYMKMNPLDIPYPIRKFVAIAAIIATEPKYLILDEPTAGQDKRGIQILEDLMEELEKEGVSVISITHDMEFVARNFSRIVVMAHKNIIADGTAREIFWNTETVKVSGIKKPQLAQVAEQLRLSGDVLFGDELTKAVFIHP
jgi:energy-coupling factor transport system ATP-binding protein